MKWSSPLPDFTAFPVDSLTERLGWCVLHFFWQGTLAALGLALLLRLCRRGTADLRHACCALALTTMALAPVLTWMQLTPSHTPSVPSATTTPEIVSLPLPLQASAPPDEIPRNEPAPAGVALIIPSLEERPEPPAAESTPAPESSAGPNWRAWLGLGWLTGAACLALTKLCGLGATFYLIRQAVPAEGAINDQARLMARRCGLKRLPRLKILNRLRSPAVAGILRPVLLIPSGALAGLSPREMDFILAHEFSHIQRHDYLTGLLQAAVETLLFFHPAVWWVSHRMNLEREHACDDRARHLTGNPRAAATALARLAELSLDQPPALAPAAASQPLLHRIQRLLAPVPSRRRSFPMLVAPAVSLLLLVPLLPLSTARETNPADQSDLSLTESAEPIPENATPSPTPPATPPTAPPTAPAIEPPTPARATLTPPAGPESSSEVPATASGEKPTSPAPSGASRPADSPPVPASNNQAPANPEAPTNPEAPAVPPPANPSVPDSPATPAPVAASVTSSAITSTATVLRGSITDRNGVVLAESSNATWNQNGESKTGDSRHYPLAALTSHVIGYIGQPPPKYPPARKAAAADKATGSVSMTGLAGVEKAMDAMLEKRPSAEGKSTPALALTLDARMQQICRQALIDAGVGRGAVVLLDVENGDILSMASLPDFDPNQMVPFPVRESFDKVLSDRTDPLINRALTGFSPGSTFKPLVALSAPGNGGKPQIYNCSGSVHYAGRPFKCWIANQGGEHGRLDLPEALAQSCNCYFYQLGNAAGIDAIAAMAGKFGLGDPAYFRLGTGITDFIPDRAWLEKQNYGPWTEAKTANVSIGQAEVRASPLQLAGLAAAIANDGKIWNPRIVSRTFTNGEWHNAPLELRHDLIAEGVPEENLAAVREGMDRTVNSPVGGTGKPARSELIHIAGKTGTAQKWRMEPGPPKPAGGKPSEQRRIMDNHTWFIGFAPLEKPRYAISILVANGKAGGSVCAPIAKRILERITRMESGEDVVELKATPPSAGHFRFLESVKYAGEDR
ncbi:MAG: hypothetical protein JWL81_3170 [Verrucomicrobiales bacterium]|nr:hypothetical protein [Verrucomicrobiales bacterium]